MIRPKGMRARSAIAWLVGFCSLSGLVLAWVAWKYWHDPSGASTAAAFWIALGVFALGNMIAWRLTVRRISRPLEALAQESAQAAQSGAELQGSSRGSTEVQSIHGSVGLLSKGLRTRSDELESLRKELALSQSTLAHRNDELATELSVRVGAITHLQNLTHELCSIHDLDVLLDFVLQEVLTLTGAQGACAFISREGSLTLQRSAGTCNSMDIHGLARHSRPLKCPVPRPIAVQVAMTRHPLVVVDPQRLPFGISYAADREFDCGGGDIPSNVVAVPLTGTQGEVIGVLQAVGVTSRGSASDPGDLQPALRQLQHIAELATIGVERTTMTRSVIERMLSMAELRDPCETGPHINRVADYAVAIFDEVARRERLSPETAKRKRDILRMSAMLHDVGKVGLSDSILKKPGPLDPQERATMQEHTNIGAHLFQGYSTIFDRAAQLVAQHHHQKWDGTGYPRVAAPGGGEARPLKGEEIPRFARIVAIADVFDALLSKRVYKQAWTLEDAITEIQVQSGRHFEPFLVECAMTVLRDLAPEKDQPAGSRLG